MIFRQKMKYNSEDHQDAIFFEFRMWTLKTKENPLNQSINQLFSVNN